MGSSFLDFAFLEDLVISAFQPQISAIRLRLNMTSSQKEIRKRKVLAIDQKLEICKLIKKGTSYDEIMNKYGIGKLKISDIKKKEQELREFLSKKTKLGI